MKQVLSDLYEGRLCPKINSSRNCCELQAAQRHVIEQEQKIAQYLPENLRLRLMDEYTNIVADFYQICREKEFIEGFCLGTRLILEVLDRGCEFDYGD